MQQWVLQWMQWMQCSVRRRTIKLNFALQCVSVSIGSVGGRGGDDDDDDYMVVCYGSDHEYDSAEITRIALLQQHGFFQRVYYYLPEEETDSICTENEVHGDDEVRALLPPLCHLHFDVLCQQRCLCH